MREVGKRCATAVLLRRAAAGEQWAWRELVDRHEPVVWSTARAFTHCAADAEDVSQATWLLLAENLGRLRSPEALPGWLATTARREAARLTKARRREAPFGLDSALLAPSGAAEGPEQTVLRSMTHTRLWRAFAELPQRCQQLLRVLAASPEASYAQISAALGMPKGTIGPKRGRCLAELRRRMVGADLAGEVAG
ncbi:sigma-70 family RNA polymerase sigma factor [Saccharopolyspora cebuensis]|uniref:RNA polymerase sigma factor n=1 Tax=Saccharopolyspora cebuensis TaxID=418759 RepID=A0ABV4CNS6_9PSEU